MSAMDEHPHGDAVDDAEAEAAACPRKDEGDDDAEEDDDDEFGSMEEFSFHDTSVSAHEENGQVQSEQVTDGAQVQHEVLVEDAAAEPEVNEVAEAVAEDVIDVEAAGNVPVVDADDDEENDELDDEVGDVAETAPPPSPAHGCLDDGSIRVYSATSFHLRPLRGRTRTTSAAPTSIFRSLRRTSCKWLSLMETDKSHLFCDVLSRTIHSQMWHLSDRILSYLDAVSLRTCEDVCLLWRMYIRNEGIWKKVVERSVLATPDLAKQNGWKEHIPALGGKDPKSVETYKELYWKMTNLTQLWSRPRRPPVEMKNHFRRDGAIVWHFLPTSTRVVSVYSSGRGYVLKIHDSMTCQWRCTHKEIAGTVKKDTLTLDATEKRIVVGGLISQKVWVFDIKEEPLLKVRRMDMFIDLIKGQLPKETNVSLKLFKFINAGNGVSKVKIHHDDKRVAVLLPINQVVEIWDIVEVVRLQSHSVASDTSYLLWQKNLLLVAPLYSGIIQGFDVEKEAECCSLIGSIRRIDSVAVYENLCATGEGKYLKLWSLEKELGLVSWIATKNFISALFMNDVFLISGSSAGIVKMWDLKTVLTKSAATVSPIRKVTMKGFMHYPIKMIHQWTYTDIAIVAKYEARKKKDKIKVVEVKAFYHRQ